MGESIIKDYTSDDYDKVVEFLESVTTLKNIEEELFNNSIIIESNDKVEGMISYEHFRGRALIRYFIFDKDVDESYLVDMYERFFIKLKERDIQKIFVIVSTDLIVDMFEDLGFYEFDKEEFYLTESNISQTKYSDSFVMCYDIE